MEVNARECEAAGLDPKEVRRIAAGLSRYAREAAALGLEIFGGSGTGDLRTEADARRAARAVLKEYSTAMEDPHPSALALFEQARN